MLSDLAKAAAPNYAAIFQTLPGLHLLLSADLRVLSATDLFLECLSVTRAQALGKPVQDLLNDSEATNYAFFAELNQVIGSLQPGNKSPQNGQWRKPVNTGTLYFCGQTWFGSLLPVPDSAGGITYLLHLETGAFNRPQAEVEAGKSHEQFRFLADTIPQLVWTTGPDGFHDYFNRRWTEFTGYSLEDSKGPDMWNNLLHPDDRERARECWNHSLKTGQPYEIEYRFKSAANGQYCWFLARAMPMRNAQGQIVKWFGTCTDISRKKLYEEELKEKNIEMKLINDDLDSFVYMASHDLKLPIINVTALFEELLLSADFRDTDSKMMVGMIQKSLKQVHETINDLSEIVKVQKNVYSRQEEVKLAPLLEDVKLTLADLIAETDAVIEADFSRAGTLHFSRVNLKSVLHNLLSNAIKYRVPGRRPHIQLQTTPEGRNLRLDVTDNGVGIDLNKHGEKLFQMFKRFHNHVEGSGLGLHIISRIMHKSGGQILVSSEPGQGTTFSLIFTNSNGEHGR